MFNPNKEEIIKTFNLFIAKMKYAFNQQSNLLKYLESTTLSDIDINNCKSVIKAEAQDLNTLMNHQGHNPIHIAALNHHWSLVDELIQKGADINHKNYEGKTALCLSIENNDWIAFAKLREMGADETIKINGKNLLYIAIEAYSKREDAAGTYVYGWTEDVVSMCHIAYRHKDWLYLPKYDESALERLSHFRSYEAMKYHLPGAGFGGNSFEKHFILHDQYPYFDYYGDGL